MTKHQSTNAFEPTTLVPDQRSWRDDLPVHPAADLFPLMSESELRELGEDIKANGLQSPVVVYDGQLIDGRNRLDAMVLVGIRFEIFTQEMIVIENGEPAVALAGGTGIRQLLDSPSATKCANTQPLDPYAYVVSANIRRRHLTAEQKRQLIADLLKVKPEASDRQIGTMAKADGKTVAKVRSELEGRAEIPHDKKRTDTKGRKQPATKSRRNSEPKPSPKNTDASAKDKKHHTGRGGSDRQIAESYVAPLYDEDDHNTDQDLWQRSLGNLAGDSIAMEAFWKRQFGDWEKFEGTSDLLTLTEHAAEAWNKLARKLRQANDAKAAA